jgi:hypothetical protein
MMVAGEQMPLAFLTPRWACDRRRDSMGNTALRQSCGQRGERSAEAGSARRKQTAVRGAR